MIAELLESLVGLVEFAMTVVEVPLRHRAAGPRVGDTFRVVRAATATAVVRPLTAQSTRFEVLVPTGARCRVELALPAPGHAIYLAYLEPLEPLLRATSNREHAASAGFWLEVPPVLLRSHFERVRRSN